MIRRSVPIFLAMLFLAACGGGDGERRRAKAPRTSMVASLPTVCVRFSPMEMVSMSSNVIFGKSVIVCEIRSNLRQTKRWLLIERKLAILASEGVSGSAKIGTQYQMSLLERYAFFGVFCSFPEYLPCRAPKFQVIEIGPVKSHSRLYYSQPAVVRRNETKLAPAPTSRPSSTASSAPSGSMQR